MENSNSPNQIIWDETTRHNFTRMIQKIPIFLRSIAEKKVSQKAEAIVRADNRTQVTEKDMIDAFFVETPFGFHGPMKSDMQELGINYMQYGHSK